MQLGLAVDEVLGRGFHRALLALLLQIGCGCAWVVGHGGRLGRRAGRNRLEQARQQAIDVERRGQVLGRGKAALRLGLMARPAVGAGDEEDRGPSGCGVLPNFLGQREATTVGKGGV